MLKLLTQKKEPRHYWLLKRYDAMVVQRKPKLIQPIKERCTTVQFYMANNELFDILHKTHVSIGHGGRNWLLKELSPNKKYYSRYRVVSSALYALSIEAERLQKWYCCKTDNFFLVRF